ncbi:MAG: AbrB/MazE/SpoVT family DNA-binding domain-containing protein [Oxalobacteraceae bacterium]
MSKVAKLTIQQWGNSLAVRIPSAVARSAHFSVGQPVELTVKDSTVVVTPIGVPKLTLAQKVALFDPAIHGGEVMATDRIGAEVF